MNKLLHYTLKRTDGLNMDNLKPSIEGCTKPKKLLNFWSAHTQCEADQTQSFVALPSPKVAGQANPTLLDCNEKLNLENDPDY